MQVVKPAYAVMVTETFDLRPNGAPSFKFGKAPAPARAGNYDDWNELFWDPWRLKRAMKIKMLGTRLLKLTATTTTTTTITTEKISNLVKMKLCCLTSDLHGYETSDFWANINSFFCRQTFLLTVYSASYSVSHSIWHLV